MQHRLLPSVVMTDSIINLIAVMHAKQSFQKGTRDKHSKNDSLKVKGSHRYIRGSHLTCLYLMEDGLADM